jgi:hypothetical protein
MDGRLICHLKATEGCHRQGTAGGYPISVRGWAVSGSTFPVPGSWLLALGTWNQEPGIRNTAGRVTPHGLASSGLGETARPAGSEPRYGRTVFSTSRTLGQGKNDELLLCTLPALHYPGCRARVSHPKTGFETTPGEVR